MAVNKTSNTVVLFQMKDKLILSEDIELNATFLNQQLERNLSW